MNVVFVLIDALRASNLGCYGYSKPTSPCIDSLSRKGMIVSKAFSTINTTDPSITSIFSGLYPSSHGILRHGVPYNSQSVREYLLTARKSLPEVFYDHGFNTMAVDWLGRWHRRGFRKYLGIDKTFLGHSRLVDELYLRNRINATAYTNAALEYMDSFSQPFFLFIHYWDLHAGYSVPRQHAKLFPADDKTKLSKVLPFPCVPSWDAAVQRMSWLGRTVGDRIAQYDGGINYIDSEISRIVARLSNRGILDDTLIIITSDHGESLVEHGIYFEHHGLYDVSVHVPLLIYAPSIVRPKTIYDGLVSHVDLYSTISSLVGFDGESRDGRNFYPAILGERYRGRSAVFFEESHTERKRGVRTSTNKFIEASSEEHARCRYCLRIHGGTKELYDLARDSDENNNLAASNTNMVREFSSLIREWAGHLATNRALAQRRQLEVRGEDSQGRS